MRHLRLILTYLIIVLPQPIKPEWSFSPYLQANAGLNVTIEAPVAGQAVQGSVVIRGTANGDGFRSYEVDFSYSQDPTSTWFLIQESTTPIQDGVLAVWDTSTITDGKYAVRVLVTRTDGTQVEVLVDGLRVRNYSPIETDTPAPIPPQLTIVPGKPTASITPRSSSTPTLTPQLPTPTSLPANPAEISTSQMMLTLGKGAALTVGIFAILGAYLGIRASLRNRK